MVTRADVVAEARSWVGTPYRHQGRGKGVAIDCIGLIWGISKNLGLPTPEVPANYMMQPKGEMLLEGCDRYLVKPEDQCLKPGRIVLIWGVDRDLPQHFAICGDFGGRLTMIHAFSKHTKVVEHGWDRFWMARILSFYDYPDVKD